MPAISMTLNNSPTNSQNSTEHEDMELFKLAHQAQGTVEGAIPSQNVNATYAGLGIAKQALNMNLQENPNEEVGKMFPTLDASKSAEGMHKQNSHSEHDVQKRLSHSGSGLHYHPGNHHHHGKKACQKAVNYVQITFLNNKQQEDSFTVCEHWCEFLTEALKAAREHKEYKWISDFNALHYAVSKYNVKMCEFLLEAPECSDYFKHYVHMVDDFYEKPIDHLCNAKHKVPPSKQPLADYLKFFMKKHPANPECEKEKIYQDIKINGPLHLRKEKDDNKNGLDGAAEDGGPDLSNVASGETGPDLTNIMTSYEVEEQLPSDMRKNFKVVVKTGLDGYTGTWTGGQSPLHWAAARGRVDICRYLIMVLNGDPEADDDKGRSAIKLAKVKKHHALARMLHTKDFPIERDNELKKKKEDSKKHGPKVAPTLTNVLKGLMTV